DAYLRSLADQENIRERSRKELISAKEFAIQKFAKDLLDTVDILNMALTSVPEGLRKKETAEEEATKLSLNIADQLTNLYTGVSMTESELVKTLKRHGVEQHNPDGEVFDPNLHQALFQAPMPDKQAGTIFSVQKLGYTLKGRVLRPAQVGVVMETK
ncbi:GrpE nucleotide exchange factor, partial [Cunninghamella echinulata]